MVENDLFEDNVFEIKNPSKTRFLDGCKAYLGISVPNLAQWYEQIGVRDPYRYLRKTNRRKIKKTLYGARKLILIFFMKTPALSLVQH